MLTQRMSETVSIVGAGRVGRALGRRLHELGWRVGGVTGRSISTARAAVRAIGAGQPLDGLTHQVLNSRVVLITTPDSAIEGVAKNLAQLGGEGVARESCAAHQRGPRFQRASAARRSGRGDGIDAPDANLLQPEHSGPCELYFRH